MFQASKSHLSIEAQKFIIFIADSLTNQTQVILVNTLHFKAPWEIPFELEGTRSATFHLNPNELIQASMMTSVGQYPYGDIQELNATAVVIPYKVGQPT